MYDESSARAAMRVEPSPNLALVHLAEQERAHALARELRSERVAVEVVELTKSVVAELVARNDDALVVAYRFGTFDLARFCFDVRASTDCPIIVLTTGGERDQDEGQRVLVEALGAGAGAIVADDTHPGVMVAQIRATIRGQPRSPREPIRIGDVAIDPEAYVLTIGPRTARVRPILFQLLLVLARHAGSILGPQQLLAEVWGDSAGDVDTRRIRIAVSRLRQALGEGPSRPVIETVPHLGYRLIVPSTPAA